MAYASDRAAFDMDSPRLAIGTVSSASAELSLSAELLGLCDHCHSTLWGRARVLDGPQTHNALPPVGRPRMRPRTVRIESK